MERAEVQGGRGGMVGREEDVSGSEGGVAAEPNEGKVKS